MTEAPQHYKVSVVLPAFNEEGNIPAVCARLQAILSHYSDYEILFVDDGSEDGTLKVLKATHRADPRICYLSLSRNFGHQQALKAGLDHAVGDCVISLDCDLQHPPELILEMMAKWLEGYDVVYTRRRDDPKLSAFKRATSRLFYALINQLADVRIEAGAADYRLLDRKVVAVIKPISDHFLFMRGLVAWLGFRQSAVYYTPQERTWGDSKYTLRRMLRLAVDGITSFSVRPLHLSTALGAGISLLAFVYACYAILMRLFTQQVVEGWTSVLVSVLFLGGAQLMMIGILGMYLGRLFVGSKSRPAYIVREKSGE
jgi:glycosyltransferase involved in cell wall biosynthesis